MTRSRISPTKKKKGEKKKVGEFYIHGGQEIQVSGMMAGHETWITGIWITRCQSTVGDSKLDLWTNIYNTYA